MLILKLSLKSLIMSINNPAKPHTNDKLSTNSAPCCVNIFSMIRNASFTLLALKNIHAKATITKQNNVLTTFEITVLYLGV